MRLVKPLLALSAVAALSACGNEEAGAFLDEGTFGNATMNNHLVQTCQDVSHDKYSGKGGGCAPRTLDGKYARETYNEYLRSAAERPRFTTTFGDAGTTGGGGGGGG